MIRPTKMKSIAIITVFIFAQVIAAPKVVSKTDKPKLQSPADISYEDLKIIIKSKLGESKPEEIKTLSPCARAILGCCNENVMDSICSENLGCGAFFFDVNPCDTKFMIDALNAARKFYEQFNTIDT